MSGFDPYEHQRGAVGAVERCPHCGGSTATAANDELFVVCRICGAPRIDLPAGVAMPRTASDALRRAEAARRSRAFARGFAVAGGLGTVAGGLLGLVVGLFSLTWGVLALLAVAGPSLAALLVSRSRAEARSKEIAAALDTAWSAAAEAVVRAGLGRTPADLATALQIEPARAAELHALIAVEAELAALGPNDGLRVAPVEADPRFEALERAAEAEAEAEAEATAGRDRAKASS